MSDISRAEWLEQRRKGLGGSDIAAMLGLSKWKSPYQLWQDKRGELPEQEDSEAMYWGRELEPVIRRRYELETGYTVIHDEGLIVDPVYPFMLANLDGRVDHPERLLEIKTARTCDGWGEIDSAEIPIAYSLQCQWYMARTGVDLCDVAVLVGASDFRLYQIQADNELQKLLEKEAIKFWGLVESGEPPEPVTYDDVVERYGHSHAAGVTVCTEDAYNAYNELTNIVKPALKHFAEKEEALKAIICKAMGDNYDALITPDGQQLATWKLAKGTTRFDGKRLQSEHPELHAKYVTTGEPSRRLLLK